MVSAGIAEAASKRSVPLKLRASDKADAEVAEEVLLYENSHTLVIGINAYINGWPRLSMAVKDAEERAKLAAERAKFAAEAEARREAEEEARRKAFAEEQAKITAERERLAKEQQALAAQQKQQLAALTPNTQARDLESLLRLNPSFDGRLIRAGTKWNLKGVNGKTGTLKFDESCQKYVFDIDPESFNGFIKCEGDVDREGNFPKL